MAAALAGGAIGCVGCSGADGSPAPFGVVLAGNVRDLPIGSLSAVPNAAALVGRDAQGFYALTATCTHEGIEVHPVQSGSTTILVCPAHGSQFDANGNVIHGPAGSALAHFAVEIDAQGNVTVHGETQVAISVRTPLPAGLT